MCAVWPPRVCACERRLVRPGSRASVEKLLLATARCLEKNTRFFGVNGFRFACKGVAFSSPLRKPETPSAKRSLISAALRDGQLQLRHRSARSWPAVLPVPVLPVLPGRFIPQRLERHHRDSRAP